MIKKIIIIKNQSLIENSNGLEVLGSFFIFYFFYTTWISKIEIKNKDLRNVYFILGCISSKNDKTYNILILQIIFTFNIHFIFAKIE